MTDEAIAKQGVPVIHTPQTLSPQHVRAQNDIGKRPLLEPQAMFLKAHEPAVVRLANHDVIQDQYVQQPASLHKLLRDVHIPGLGVGFPNGWLCTRTIAGQLERSASWNTSPKRTSTEETLRL
jgi:hypothetical protein